MGIFNKNMGGNFPGGNFLGGNFSGGNYSEGNFPGGSLMGGNFPGGNFPGKSFPDTPENIRKPYGFLMFSGGKERVNWEQMGQNN